MRRRRDDEFDQPVKVSDLGTPEIQRRGVIIKLNDNTGQLQSRRKAVRAIDYYWEEEYIESHHFEAAERLADDYAAHKAYFSAIMPSARIRSCNNPDYGRELDDGEKEVRLQEQAIRYKEYMARVSVRDRLFAESLVKFDPYMDDLFKIKQAYSHPLVINAARDLLDMVAKFYGIRWHHERY